MTGMPWWLIGLSVLTVAAWLAVEERGRRVREPRNCRPPAGAIHGAGDVYDIWFVSGGESLWRTPALIKPAGLSHRLAVIQHTAIREETEMHLDDALWICLLHFMQSQATNAYATVARKADHLGQHETGIDTYLAEWNAQSPDDHQPAEVVVVRNGGAPTHVLVTEFWVNIGGPYPYADSYTYSIYSDDDLSVELPAFLAERCAGRWNQATEVLLANELA